MTRFLMAVVILTLIYALALSSLHPWDLAFGAALSAALLLANRRFVFGLDRTEAARRRPALLGRIVAFFPFGLVVLRDVLVGTWEVAMVTLHLRPLKSPGIVAVPIEDRTRFGVAVWAVTTGLTPGAFFVEVDNERQVALIHIVDASDPEGFREEQREFYRRYQSKVFP